MVKFLADVAAAESSKMTGATLGVFEFCSIAPPHMFPSQSQHLISCFVCCTLLQLKAIVARKCDILDWRICNTRIFTAIIFAPCMGEECGDDMMSALEGSRIVTELLTSAINNELNRRGVPIKDTHRMTDAV